MARSRRIVASSKSGKARKHTGGLVPFIGIEVPFFTLRCGGLGCVERLAAVIAEVVMADSQELLLTPEANAPGAAVSATDSAARLALWMRPEIVLKIRVLAIWQYCHGDEAKEGGAKADRSPLVPVSSKSWCKPQSDHCGQPQQQVHIQSPIFSVCGPQREGPRACRCSPDTRMCD